MTDAFSYKPWLVSDGTVHPSEGLLLPNSPSASLPTYIVGIDPGGTIGYAGVRLFPSGLIVLLTADELPAEEAPVLLHSIVATAAVTPNLHLAVEDYIGSGPRDKNAINAIMLIGAFMGVGTVSGATVLVRAPQLRRAFLGKASTLADTEMGRHSIDALAHALAYAHDTFGNDLANLGNNRRASTDGT